MADKKREQHVNRPRISHDVLDFVQKRAREQRLSSSSLKEKRLQIKLLISELENLCLTMPASDPNVVSAKSKLLELKTLITDVFDTK